MLRVRIHPHILLTNQPIGNFEMILPETLPPIVFPSFSKKVATLRNSAIAAKTHQSLRVGKISRIFFVLRPKNFKPRSSKWWFQTILRWTESSTYTELYWIWAYVRENSKQPDHFCVTASIPAPFLVTPEALGLSKTRQIKAKRNEQVPRQHCPKILENVIQKVAWPGSINSGWSEVLRNPQFISHGVKGHLEGVRTMAILQDILGLNQLVSYLARIQIPWKPILQVRKSHHFPGEYVFDQTSAQEQFANLQG